jgi:nucleoside diphosphate kinase
MSAAREINIIFSDDIPDYNPTHQRTLALIKPDVAGNEDIVETIKSHIREIGLTIMKEKKLQFTLELASEFYQEHVNKEFFPSMAEFITR